MNTSIVVFHLVKSAHGTTPMCDDFLGDLMKAIKHCETLRKRPDVSHVVLSSQVADMVGKVGVDSIEAGLTPDGHQYEWSKAERAGKMRKSDLNKPVPTKNH